MPTPNPLTDEQAQRAEALAQARRALEHSTGKGPFSADRSFDLAYLSELLGVADWIVTGVRVERLNEHPAHVALHRAADGAYTELTRVGEPPATFQTTTGQLEREHQRATEQDQPLMHHHVGEQVFTACGEVWATVAHSTDDESAVTCERCILALHDQGRG